MYVSLIVDNCKDLLLFDSQKESHCSACHPFMWSEFCMWCDLGESVGSRTCDIFSFLFDWEVLIRSGTFCWKRPLNRSSGSKVMSNWRILGTIENNRNAFLFLAISDNQWCRLQTDPNRSQHLLFCQPSTCVSWITWKLVPCFTSKAQCMLAVLKE